MHLRINDLYTFSNMLHDTNQNLQIPFGFAGEKRKENNNFLLFLASESQTMSQSDRRGLEQYTKLIRFGYRDYDAYAGLYILVVEIVILWVCSCGF